MFLIALASFKYEFFLFKSTRKGHIPHAFHTAPHSCVHWLWEYVVWWLWKPKALQQTIFTASPAYWEPHQHTFTPVSATHWKVWHLGNFSWHWYNYFFKSYPLQFSVQTLSSDDCFHRALDETLDGSWHSNFSLLIFNSLLATRQCFKKKLVDQFINSWIKANLIPWRMGKKSSWLKWKP